MNPRNEVSLHTDMRHAVYALSDALDLVGVDDVAHGKRVGIIAAECARYAGYDEAAIGFWFDLGLVHDIGVSSTHDHRQLVNQFEWESSQLHCEVGFALVKDFRPLANLAEPILLHHTRWNDPVMADVPEPIREQANLLYLADRVDALAARFYADRTLLNHTAAIREQIAARAGIYFAPHLVAIFLAASDRPAFWLNLEPRAVEFFLLDHLSRHALRETPLAEVKQLADIFSRIVDAKSPYTVEHSHGVAQMARQLAMRMGLSPGQCDKIEIAGLLHDLGKLRIPDAILEKPGPLDAVERQIVNTHSFETSLILRRIPGFEEIARWAAYHHEQPNGQGYPFGVKGPDFPTEARIIAVSDVVQAMLQDRPYRSGYTPAQLQPFLENLAAEGRLDADIVALVIADLAAYAHLAMPNRSRAH